MQHETRPSKCPTLYTNRISQEQNLRQKECKICQNWSLDKISYLIKYTLQYSFQYKTIQDSYIIKLPGVTYYSSTFHWTFTMELNKIWTKKLFHNKTLYVQSKQITPVQEILHQRCWWCWRHLEGLHETLFLTFTWYGAVMNQICLGSESIYFNA